VSSSLGRKSTYRFIVLEDTTEQLVSDGVVGESEVDDVDVRRRLDCQQRTRQPRREVQTKPVRHFHFFVADLHPPIASLHRHLFGKARNRPIKRLVYVLDEQWASHRRGVLQVTVKLLAISASYLD